jgi:hypothetical protein
MLLMWGGMRLGAMKGRFAAFALKRVPRNFLPLKGREKYPFATAFRGERGRNQRGADLVSSEGQTLCRNIKKPEGNAPQPADDSKSQIRI